MDNITWFNYSKEMDELINVISVNKNNIRINKDFLKEVRTRFTRASKVQVGCNNGTIFLKFGENKGQVFINLDKAISIQIHSLEMQEWFKEQDIKRGNYIIEYVGNGLYQCIYVE
jgi:predicted acetyltransferase